MVIVTRSYARAHNPSDSEDDEDNHYHDDSDSESSDAMIDMFMKSLMRAKAKASRRTKRKLSRVNKNEEKSKRQRVDIPEHLRVKDWDSLLRLAEESSKYGYKECRIIEDVYPVLKKIDALVGMKDFKQSLVEKIVAYTCEMPEKGTMHHVSIVGPTGSGKTTIARLIGELFAAMGITSNPEIIMGTQSEMIGGYVGHTAIKTSEMVTNAIESGRPLFMDEFYGFTGDYGDKCVQTLLPYLTDNADDFVLIVAGYEEDMKEMFRSNEGLRRRFPWHFVLPAYNPEELKEIFIRCYDDGKYSMPDDLDASFFSKYSTRFTQNGGSVKNLVAHVRVSHNFRTHGRPEIRGDLTMDDLHVAVKRLPEEKDNGSAPVGMYL